MTNELTQEHTEAGQVDRGADGEVIPEDHTVELPNGEEAVIKTIPMYTGVMNELNHLDDGLRELDPEAIYEAFQTLYKTDALTEMSVEEIRDTKAPWLNAYLTPVEEQTEMEIDGGDDEGNPAEMSKQERAKQMR